MKHLSFTCKDQLVWLEVVDCKSVTEEGLESLTRMDRLRILHIENLKYVKDPEKSLSILKEALPKCNIKYPPYTDSPSEIDW